MLSVRRPPVGPFFVARKRNNTLQQSQRDWQGGQPQPNLVTRMYLDVGTNVVQLCGPSNKTWGWIPFILADKGAYWAPWKTDEGTLTDGKRVAPQQGVSLKLGTIATLWELAYELKDGCIHPVCAGREWPGLLSANREKIVLLLCGLSSVASRQLPAVEVTLLLSLTSAKWANRSVPSREAAGMIHPTTTLTHSPLWMTHPPTPVWALGREGFWWFLVAPFITI